MQKTSHWHPHPKKTLPWRTKNTELIFEFVFTGFNVLIINHNKRSFVPCLPCAVIAMFMPRSHQTNEALSSPSQSQTCSFLENHKDD
jgi:hypothetical protein